jgi:hypothetical protein
LREPTVKKIAVGLFATVLLLSGSVSDAAWRRYRKGAACHFLKSSLLSLSTSMGEVVGGSMEGGIAYCPLELATAGATVQNITNYTVTTYHNNVNGYNDLVKVVARDPGSSSFVNTGEKSQSVNGWKSVTFQASQGETQVLQACPSTWVAFFWFDFAPSTRLTGYSWGG